MSVEKPAEKLYCENCGKLVDYKIKVKKETYNIRGEEVTIDAKVPVCVHCGNELMDVYIDDLNFERAYKEYAKRHNLVYGDEIKGIRSKYGISQELFAKILGIGRATLARLESGALPSESISTLVKQAENPKNFLSILENAKERISIRDYERVKEKVLSTMQESETEELEEFLRKKNPNLDVLKLYGTVAYLLKRMKDIFKVEYINKVRFVKFLWFIDNAHAKEHGRGLTGLSYAHLPMGPSPESHNILMELLENAGVVRIEEELKDDYEIFKIFLKDESFEAYLTDEEKSLIDEVVESLGNLPTKKLIEIPHDDSRWINTSNGELIKL